MMVFLRKLALGFLFAAAVCHANAQSTTSFQDLAHKTLVLRGTLGGEQVQMTLHPKQDEDGLAGTYFIFGQGAQILLAGEADHDDLVMEESHNGKDVSGEWAGEFKNGVLSGTWSALDGAVSKPFVLNLTAP
ncbi:hypothetical protein FHW67_000183 [Herbaspirillum sp. Sphag1AN]|uniref:hypothetical protein n=1 Tax=unclassified Herbaspirillum TaxID=2624150 RepID=UPI0016163174|nr:MULTISPECIES: hypothetical protein [unclassified Herbaspirillum]MBB3210948.1 hypothetical protein [Herbaspirillum sp. Sphag1AN]MBB3244578.1 hypothetical protein [Herbaspirillum sp. Sphag64]